MSDSSDNASMRIVLDRYDSDHVAFNNSNSTFDRLNYFGMDDQIDTLEDSPLLINDGFSRETRESEFHCHGNTKHKEDKVAWKKLLIAAILCFLFMLGELVGGYLAGSLAIMTDAAHLLSDLLGFLISLLSIRIARKNPSRSMTFGFYRTEVLGALLAVQIIWLLSIIFSVLAVRNIIIQDQNIDSDAMLIVAGCGVGINIIMGAVLHGLCLGHSHGIEQNSHHHHSHHGENINVRAAAAHVIGDLLQSIGVLIAALVIKYVPNSEIADPICTLIFSVIAVCVSLKVARDAIIILLEGNPRNSTDIALSLGVIPGVKHVHSLCIWSLAPERDALTVHLAVDQLCNRDLVIEQAMGIVRKEFSVVSCAIQVEGYNDEMISSCNRCQMKYS